MESSFNWPMEATCKGLGTSISEPHALDIVWEHVSNDNVPHISEYEVGDYQRIRAHSNPHMSHSTQAMNLSFLKNGWILQPHGLINAWSQQDCL